MDSSVLLIKSSFVDLVNLTNRDYGYKDRWAVLNYDDNEDAGSVPSRAAKVQPFTRRLNSTIAPFLTV